MTLNLTDSELKTLVKKHINELIGVPEDRLRITFTRRQTQTDTSVEILKEGEPKSIIESDAQADEVVEETQEQDTVVSNTIANLK